MTFSWRDVLALALLSVSTSAASQSTVNGARPAEPRSIVVAVDTGSSPRVGVDEIRAGLKTFISRLRASDRVSICSFGEQMQCSPFSSDQRVLSEQVDSLRDHEDARTLASIDAAVDQLSRRDGRRIVIAFTMAPDARRQINPRSVLEDARSAGASIYVVGLDVRYFDGDEFVDGRPDPDLERIARETGGKYVEVDDSSDIASAFSRVANEIR